jgi:predicted phosphodiesterase
MNFIQLTDLHIGDHPSEEYENLDRIVKDIQRRFTPERCPVIMITGDFVHHGTDEEYLQVVQKHSELKADGYQLLACPGNHDFGQGTQGNFNRYQPAARSRYLRYIHNQLLGVDQDKQEEWDAGKTVYPAITVFQEERVVFVGLDTMHGVLDEKVHLATGKVDYNQIMRVTAELRDAKYNNFTKIVYMHHNLYSDRPTMYLKYRDKLEAELVAAGVHQVCFGHTHNFEMYTSSGLTQSMKSLCGRKVTDEFKPNDGLKHTLEYYHYIIDKGIISATSIQFQ